MKKETKDISVTTYIAKDGKDFSSEEDCLAYELLLEKEERYQAARKHVDTLIEDVSDGNFPFILLSEFVNENGNMARVKTNMRHKCEPERGTYQYYKLYSKEDLNMLAEVLAHDSYGKTTPDEIIRSAGKLQYPCAVVCGFSYGWGRKVGSFTNEVKLIEKYCELHGFKITLEEIDK